MREEEAGEVRINRGLEVRIVRDNCSENPRTVWDNLGTIVAWHRRYNLSDEEPDCDPNDFFLSLARGIDRDVEEENKHNTRKIARIVREKYIMLPIYLYDHSGLILNTTGFLCRWDSGQVGYIYATKASIMEAYGVKKWTRALHKRALKALDGEVKTLSDYIEGNAYGFNIIEKGEITDACWGFYGDNHVDSGLIEALPLSPRQKGRVARALGLGSDWAKYNKRMSRIRRRAVNAQKKS